MKFQDFSLKFHFIRPYFILFILAICINGLLAQSSLPSSFQRVLNVDQNVSLVLRWSLDREARLIVLNVEAQTNGYIALGLTKRGFLEGADVIILGVDNNGAPYLHDMYGVDNSTIGQDATQDWRLLSAERSAERINMTIQRVLDTCDYQDMAFNQSLIKLVWDYGNNHSIPSQLDLKGEIPVYFWDPAEYSISNVQDIQRWRISRTFRIPPRHTSYWCTIHKRGPLMRSKHHTVAMTPYFRDDESRKHVHHQLMYRCSAPPGVEPSLIFERFINHPGEECYVKDEIQLPSVLCREVVHSWGLGGEGAILPDDLGIPVGDTLNEYYMLESHYDNPEVRSDLVVENGVDFQSTPHLRPTDSGIIFVGHGILGTFVMPPKTASFEVVGQCSSQCTKQMLPVTGMQIRAASLHSHLAGRKMRLRHFRGNRELPWIIYNDNIDFAHQQMRNLPTPRTVLPGDHLVLHCDYDNTWKNDSTISGFSTRDEMCMSFLLVDKRLPYTYCGSEYKVESTMSRFGIRNMTWELERHQRVVNSAVNQSIVGLTVSEVVGNFSAWSQQEKDELEREQMYGALAYVGLQLEALSGNILQIPVLPQANPTRQSLVSPGTLSTVRFPSVEVVYTPPTCNRPESGGNGTISNPMTNLRPNFLRTFRLG
ncbi:DBH-like monooxygenase protein 2 [Orchesella cincta]|uniref:DBH-like monooxygenase protein 2 n=1 Tax=Orchesella cincta TaxID=48709 RepID=A0A1D2NJY8_ORCCI|nr:DBH-like monooxygenase protein 2 [Orchesella cincta]